MAKSLSPPLFAATYFSIYVFYWWPQIGISEISVFSVRSITYAIPARGNPSPKTKFFLSWYVTNDPSPIFIIEPYQFFVIIPRHIIISNPCTATIHLIKIFWKIKCSLIYNFQFKMGTTFIWKFKKNQSQDDYMNSMCKHLTTLGDIFKKSVVTGKCLLL